MSFDESEDEEKIEEIEEERIDGLGASGVAISDNECFAALSMQMERIDLLSKIWLAAMQIDKRNGEDDVVLDVLRHELKISLQDSTFDKCVKSLALRTLAQIDSRLKISDL